MDLLLKNKANLLIALLTLALITLAIIGAINNFTPVPYWDMWSGYLDFFVKASSGEWSTWWAPHNEHRILLARILFWSDLNYFNGSLVFLIVFNYIFAFTSAIIFYKFLKDINSAASHKTITHLGGLLIAAWLFSWSQQENFTWGFQSQFFLAQLIPLTSFYFLYKSTSLESNTAIPWLTACVCGTLSIATMANGVITLPLMALYSICLRQEIRRSGTLVVLSAITITLYFYGYQAPEKHGSITQALQNNPTGLLKYILLYIGGPFYYFLGQSKTALIAAQLLGLTLIIASAIFLAASFKHPKSSHLRLALIFFILYIGGTALGTAGGRLFLGVEQALSSRYMTPALMAWVAFFILSLDFYYTSEKNRLSHNNFKNFKLLVALLLIVILPHQLNATVQHHDELFERKVAALALELRIKDQQQIQKVFPWADAALRLTETPVRLNLSIFGTKSIIDAKKSIETQNQIQPTTQCQGSLDNVSAVDEDARYVHVSGWIFDPTSKSSPTSMKITNSEKLIMGYALTGKSRPDVARSVDKNAFESGFQGYLLKEQLGSEITFIGSTPNCWFKSDTPKIYYTLRKAPPSTTLTNINATNITMENSWTGKDSWNSEIDKMHVFGSWIHSDADTGSISLILKKGDKLFYRSGPTGGRQLLEIENSGQKALSLPVAEEWTLLDFSEKSLPEQFKVKISDLGDGWGEWSAIAVNSKN